MTDIATSNDIYYVKKRLDKLEKIVEILLSYSSEAVKTEVQQYRKELEDEERELSKYYGM